MKDITYATKIWRREFVQVLERHRGAELIIANNLGKRIVDIGDTDDKYYLPELEAVKQCETKYILWYSSDVIPPETDWVSEAIPLLEQYPIVSCRWDDDDRHGVKTDFGWTDYHFTDQCYIAKADYMRSIDYDTEHPIARDYPQHGGNSFERRVAQWLANQGTPVAFLTNHRYHHIDSRDKVYED